MAMARGGKTTKQQTRNIQRYNTAKDKLAAAQDKARQAAEKAQEKAQEKARQKEREKAQRFTEKQRAAEAQANAKNATARQRVNDYLREMSKPENQAANRPAETSAADARETAWSKAKASHQNGITGTVGANGQNNPADVARLQEALVGAGVMDPAAANGYAGTTIVEAIKSLQRKNGLPASGTIIPGGKVEAMLMNDQAIQEGKELLRHERNVQNAESGVQSALREWSTAQAALEAANAEANRLAEQLDDSALEGAAKVGGGAVSGAAGGIPGAIRGGLTEGLFAVREASDAYDAHKEQMKVVDRARTKVKQMEKNLEIEREKLRAQREAYEQFEDSF
ncbi:peptidoglycan-binding protein [Pseudomonadota bacterium]